MDFLDSLDLPVRATNVLRYEGIDSLSKFMALTWADVKKFEHAGRRTWAEIKKAQTLNISYQEDDSRWRTFMNATAHLNDFMVTHPDFRVVLAPDGCLIAVRSSLEDADRRFQK